MKIACLAGDGIGPEIMAEARRVLGSFLFSGDVVHQKAGTLSGGEKTRLALATLVVSGANVLLLAAATFPL